MKITYELDLNTFEAWSGAVDTLNRVINEGKVDVLEAVLEDCYPDGLDETALNDILWFEDEWVFEMCGISDEEEEDEDIDPVDCGDYGYIADGDCYIIYHWENGWKDTGLSFDCTEAEAERFCKEYNGYNLDELIEEMNI